MKHIGLIAVAFLGLAFGSTNAFAENAHSYNGSFCKAYSGSQEPDFLYAGYLRNRSTSARYVTCPVIVDEIADTSGTSRVYANVTGTGTFRCYFYSMNYNGTIRQSKSASRTNSGWLYLPDVTADDYYGSYVMICSLPGNGRLNTVWVGENN